MFEYFRKTQEDITLLEEWSECSIKQVNIQFNISQLLHPKSSHMDFNIACALHLASQGMGKLLSKDFFAQESFKSAIDEIYKNCSSKEELKEDLLPKGSQKSYDANMITKLIQDKLDISNLDQFYEKWMHIPAWNVTETHMVRVLYLILQMDNDSSTPVKLESTCNYNSSAKVLMSGLGADEVFGGYARYSTAR